MTNALDIANYIISKCAEEGESVSNLQLQRILYIVQKTFLNIGMRAFEDDFEAWQIGPVIMDVYNRYCGFGAVNYSATSNRASGWLCHQNFSCVTGMLAMCHKHRVSPL